MLAESRIRGHVDPADSMVQWHRHIFLHMLVEDRNILLGKIMVAAYFAIVM